MELNENTEIKLEGNSYLVSALMEKGFKEMRRKKGEEGSKKRGLGGRRVGGREEMRKSSSLMAGMLNSISFNAVIGNRIQILGGENNNEWTVFVSTPNKWISTVVKQVVVLLPDSFAPFNRVTLTRPPFELTRVSEVPHDVKLEIETTNGSKVEVTHQLVFERGGDWSEFSISKFSGLQKLNTKESLKEQNEALTFTPTSLEAFIKIKQALSNNRNKHLEEKEGRKEEGEVKEGEETKEGSASEEESEEERVRKFKFEESTIPSVTKVSKIGNLLDFSSLLGLSTMDSLLKQSKFAQFFLAQLDQLDEENKFEIVEQMLRVISDPTTAPLTIPFLFSDQIIKKTLQVFSKTVEKNSLLFSNLFSSNNSTLLLPLLFSILHPLPPPLHPSLPLPFKEESLEEKRQVWRTIQESIFFKLVSSLLQEKEESRVEVLKYVRKEGVVWSLLSKLEKDHFAELVLILLDSECRKSAQVEELMWSSLHSEKLIEELISNLSEGVHFTSSLHLSKCENATKIFNKIISSNQHDHLNDCILSKLPTLFLSLFGEYSPLYSPLDSPQIVGELSGNKNNNKFNRSTFCNGIPLLSDLSMMTFSGCREIEEKLLEEATLLFCSHLQACSHFLNGKLPPNEHFSQLSQLRVVIVNLVISLLMTMNPSFEEKIVELEILPSILSLFFQFQNANLLQQIITDNLICLIIEDGREELINASFSPLKFDLLSKIDAQLVDLTCPQQESKVLNSFNFFLSKIVKTVIDLGDSAPQIITQHQTWPSLVERANKNFALYLQKDKVPPRNSSKTFKPVIETDDSQKY